MEIMRKVFLIFIAFVGWFALILQFVLMMNNPGGQVVSVFERILRFFGYFTILTNLIVAITTTAIAFFSNTRFGMFASQPSVQAAVASYITMVGLVYSLFLRAVWDPQGWQAMADHLLHDAIPLAFVIYWLIFAPKQGVRLTDPFKWLVYPMIYIAYSLLRGAFVAWYPYWFVDVTQLGYPTALTNTAGVLLAFLVVGFIYAGVAKLFTHFANADAV